MKDLTHSADAATVEEALAGQEHVANRADFNARVHDALGRFLYKETRRRPMILPIPMYLPAPSERALMSLEVVGLL